MKKISERSVYEGQWLSVHESVCQAKDGRQVVWESIRRKKSSVGVVVLARLIPSNRIILIKQYRPAIDGYILSLPAGLGFNDPQHALVELKEETGYIGKIVSVSPILKTGASLVDDSAYIVCVHVDENDPINEHPKQELEAGEDIQVFLVSPQEAHEFLLSQKEQGIHIASNLWYLFGLNDWLKNV
ncbi:MAG: NUDIX hydrolase [Candidatus Omnitrophota bacterium]